jgi:hypothetical protein
LAKDGGMEKQIRELRGRLSKNQTKNCFFSSPPLVIFGNRKIHSLDFKNDKMVET